LKQIQLTARGITPLLTHNERLANPFDPITKEIKSISGKRKKTEDDLLEMARLEWTGGLYHDDQIGPFIPGFNMLAALVQAGKVHKLGTAIKRSALVLEDKIKIEYAGPQNIGALFADKRFVDMRSVKIGTSKVLRARPKFDDWKLRFTIAFDESVLQIDDLMRVAQTAGAMTGIGDYRPRFGRFEVSL
jgi:hypothetical protein